MAGQWGLKIKSLIFLYLIWIWFFLNYQRQSNYLKYIVFIPNKNEFPYWEQTKPFFKKRFDQTKMKPSLWN